jgi:hypothetical protein
MAKNAFLRLIRTIGSAIYHNVEIISSKEKFVSTKLKKTYKVFYN